MAAGGSRARFAHRLLVICVLLASAQPALASNKIDTAAGRVRLRVTDSGAAAVVTYRAHGRTHVVTARGAVNAILPNPAVPQARFRLRYGAPGAARGSCGRYDGAALHWLVAACKGPDGSFWALQSWPRNLPDYGLPPSRRAAAWDLRLSHWRGRLPVLMIGQDWAYGGRFDHLYGAVAYLGRPVHGFRTDRHGRPLDRYGVLVYLDTLDSAYGPGWRRENSFVVHRPKGIFCYGLFPHGNRPPGKGRAYRITVVGPGVLPDLFWEAPAPGPYQRVADAAANAVQRRAFADRLCRPN